MACITASIVVLGEKLDDEPTNHSVGLRVVSGALFLRSSRVRPTLLMACERLPRTWTVHKKRTQGVRGLVWEAYMLCVSCFPI
jgi:hypothetical protein